MVSILRKLRSFLLCGCGKPGDGYEPLDQDASDPTPIVEELEPELVQERAKCAKLKQERDEFAEAKGKLEKEIQKLNIKLAESRAAVARVQERLDDKDKLLSERTAELTAAQAFLSRVDAVSDAEVVGMVENLNALIDSASGAISDTWDQREPVSETAIEESDAKKIRDDFGNFMLEQISAGNSIAVTLAINAYLIHFVRIIILGWGGGDATGILGEIYGMISTKESQTIASRWRALTRRYLPHQEPPRGEEIISGLAQILMTTRTFSDFSEAMESVTNSAGTEVAAIIEAALRFEDTIKTKVAFSEMSVYVVPPGETFVEATMTDEFGKGRTREEGESSVVAGTMEIGLRQRIGDVEKVLRKPKVILERDLVEPGGENEQ